VQIDIQPLKPGEQKPFPQPLGFGRCFADRMFSQRYTPDKGWHDARIGPYEPFVMDPASAVFHYGQEIFEGLKAYRRPDGKINLFRPWENAARFNRSAHRMAMAELDPEDHVEAIATLVSVVHEAVPSQPDASLYIRPTLIATDVGLGVHASHSYLHFIIAGPVGPYFSTGFNPVAVYVSRDKVRAVRGGTGEAKAGGNYAASLYVAEEVGKLGFQQVVWLDAVERRYVEEVGAKNNKIVIDGKVVTPMLNGSILPGITRDSILTLSRHLGYEAEERRLSIEEVFAAARAGKLDEAFGTGTAAVVSPVGKLCWKGECVGISGGKIGPITQKLYDTLTGMQYGDLPDEFGWIVRID